MNYRISLISFCVLTCTVALTVYIKNLAPLEKRSPIEGVTVQTTEPVLPTQVLKPSAEEVSEVKVVEIKKETGSATVLGSVPNPDTIEEFKTLQAKVFKTDQDRAQIKKVTQNSAYLYELSEYLRNVASVKNPEFRENQNIAIDILVEALKEGDSEAAKAALFEIIKDPQIENASLDMSVRESLAGVKADVLYQGSALKPELFTQVESILPGPVSQKIWKNIQQKQAENFADSEAERQARVAEVSH